MDFAEKVCIVTGGSRGIGKEIVNALLKRGARCLIADILYKVRFNKIAVYITDASCPIC